MIRKQKFLFYRQKFNDYKNPKDVWKEVKNLTKTGKVQEVPICPNILASHFKKHPMEIRDSIVSSNNNFLNYMGPHIEESFKFKAVQRKTIVDILTNLNCSRSYGPDSVSNYILKNTGLTLVNHLVHIFNVCIIEQKIPDEWKVAHIIPIYKKGDPIEPVNYRPISLISPVYKLFEKALYFQMAEFCGNHNILSEHQHGFRKGRSTESAINILTEALHKNISENNFCPTLLLDFSKAFDTVDPEILLSKLQYYGFSQSALKIIAEMVCDRKIVVKVRDKFSQAEQILSGVPQGSVLGPFLFILYINDFHNCLNNANVLQYADDTLIHTHGKNLNQAISSLTDDFFSAYNWFNVNKLKLNINKTKFIIFSTKHNLKISCAHSKEISLNNQVLKFSPTCSVNYLGITLDSELNFHSHISQLCKNISRKLGFLSHTKFLLPLKIRKLIYSSLILPNITYCINGWSHTNVTSLNHLKVIYNRICRSVLLTKRRDMSTQQLYQELNWLNLEQYIKFHLAVLAYKFVNHLLLYELPFPEFINSIVDYPLRTNNNFRLPLCNHPNKSHMLTYRSSKIWNRLPENIKSINTISSFKKHLKVFLQSNSLND